MLQCLHKICLIDISILSEVLNLALTALIAVDDVGRGDLILNMIVDALDAVECVLH